jgi:hypothetical protein
MCVAFHPRPLEDYPSVVYFNLGVSHRWKVLRIALLASLRGSAHRAINQKTTPRRSGFPLPSPCACTGLACLEEDIDASRSSIPRFCGSG